MSGWQELKAERNRRSLVRLTKSVASRISTSRTVPCSCPSLRSTDAAACNRVILGRPSNSADRLARALAARSQAPDGWTWRLGDRRSDLPFTFRTPPAPYREGDTRWGQDFAACAVNLFTASAGTLTFGRAVPTRMRCGTALAWSPGSSGMRRVARSNCCGASKVGGALKAAGGCGGMPKLTIASRCSGSGANTETRPGRDCSIFGVCQTFR